MTPASSVDFWITVSAASLLGLHGVLSLLELHRETIDLLFPRSLRASPASRSLPSTSSLLATRPSHWLTGTVAWRARSPGARFGVSFVVLALPLRELLLQCSDLA